MQIMALLSPGLHPPRLDEPPLSDETWELIGVAGRGKHRNDQELKLSRKIWRLYLNLWFRHLRLMPELHPMSHHQEHLNPFLTFSWCADRVSL